MKRPILIVAAIVLVLVGIRIVAGLNGPDDKQLVRQALADSIKASKEGRPGGVMDKISNKLTVNDTEVGQMGNIANFIKQSRPDVEVLTPDPVILGDEARITSPVKVSMSLPGGAGFDRTIDNVILIFAKEDSMTWLIFPSKQWRLKEVKMPDDVMGQLSQN